MDTWKHVQRATGINCAVIHEPQHTVKNLIQTAFYEIFAYAIEIIDKPLWTDFGRPTETSDFIVKHMKT